MKKKQKKKKSNVRELRVPGEGARLSIKQRAPGRLY